MLVGEEIDRGQSEAWEPEGRGLQAERFTWDVKSKRLDDWSRGVEQ